MFGMREVRNYYIKGETLTSRVLSWVVSSAKTWGGGMKRTVLGRSVVGGWVGGLALCAGLTLSIWGSVAGAESAASAVAAPGGEARIAEFLPQGRVSAVEAVQVRFAAPAVAFGDAKAEPPVVLECEGRAPQGQGRWLDDTRWTFVFDSSLPAGVRCVATANPEFKDLEGRLLPAGLRQVFDTGAPSVVDLRPYRGMTIDEEQVFILRFDAGVDAQEVAQRSYCSVQGLAEKIPVRVMADEHREPLMRAAYLPQPDDPNTVALLQCARVLPPEALVRLEVGPGIRALEQPEQLGGSEEPQVWEYDVRPPFTARMSCTRERAGRPCLPITPISVVFSAPVPRAALSGVRLSSGDTVFEMEQPDEELEVISYVSFPGPFPAEGKLSLRLPEGLQDDAGRPLENAERFPLEFETADHPPLARFASGTFGVIERFAHGQPGAKTQEPPAVPVTLRHVEAQPSMRAMGWSVGQVASLRTMSDAEVLGWYARLQRLESGRWSRAQVQDILAGRAPRQTRDSWASRLDARAVSALKDQPAARRLSLPGAAEDEQRPFEVVGVPLDEPGFHVLEIESPRLGASLLEDGSAMYVRTGVLLTNLSLHVKQGRDDLLVWVTTLADAQPVADAEISVLDCNGRLLLRGRSDVQGLWHHLAAVEAPRYCRDTGLEGLFISARIADEHPQAHGTADYSFVMSSWDRGIESWRFNVPTQSGPEPTLLTHTVFDRSLFRAGETVSMKHFLREETRDGLRNPAARRPDRLIIEHEGSSQRHEFPLTWQETPSGGLMALSEFSIPQSAHLGSYAVQLTDASRRWYGSSQFRVEEFRLPMLAGQLAVRSEERPGTLVAPDALAVDMQLAWLSGGPAMEQEVELSAVAEDRGVYLADYAGYSFMPPPRQAEEQSSQAVADSWADEQTGPRRQLFVDGLRFKLDPHGMATLDIDSVPPTDRPRRFVFEAGFADPNGEIQTLSQSVDVWPSAVQAGVKVQGWDRAGQDIPVSLIALGLDSQPREGVKMRLLAVERKTYTVRKRMVGGFYRYDSHTERQDAGTLCEGVTNAVGMIECTARFDEAGSFELVAVAEDEQGRTSRAYTSLWVSGVGELWFGGADDDRIDLIPAKRQWAADEQAEFQVRMPFREATALVSVEREGVLWTDLVRLEGKNPVVKVPVSAAWGPNAYVSVLVLRGRLYELPWQSFFDWGWRRPASWLKAWGENQDDMLVTSQIDLAKPAFRLGVAELGISGEADRLKVELTPDNDVLHVREEGSARVKVSLPDGTPAAHGTVAFAVVDEALLELAPNESWSLYEAMHPRRRLGVRTATSQMEVVGRRHYGRKAVAAGGGGGSLPTRQLFDTLISWQPAVQLDANGEAELRFRMNDALSRFRLVAMADHGAGHFGSDTAAVVTRQDLQLVSGLPPVVREADRYQAAVTLRNGSEQEREIEVIAIRGIEGEEQRLPMRSLRLAPGESGSVSWEIEVPELRWPAESATVDWRFEASDDSVADRVAVTQRIEPRLPVTTVQATLLGLAAGESAEVPVAPPVAAQLRSDGVAFGGIAVDVSSSLVGSLEGVRDWWLAYPYTCLEQTASQAIALNDVERWRKVVARLVTHMDDDGLLRYFPGTGPGSDVLTAYLVSVSDDAQRLGLDLQLPQDALQRMLNGLQAFAQGRIRRDMRLSSTSLDSRRLMAIEALARHGRVNAGMLSSLVQPPEQWPTPTVVDWLSVLTRLPNRDQHQQEIAQARSILVSRMTVSGAAMMFSDTSLNAAPGLMATRVTSLARLMLAVAEEPQWQEDMPRMVQGLLALQRRGRWAITTENVLGGLALSSYARQFEAQPASGSVQASLGQADAAIVLPSPGETASGRLDWPQGDEPLQLDHQGQGRAWIGLRAQARMMEDEPQGSGYRLERRVVPVQRLQPDSWSRGDIYRVEIDIHSRDTATWVVLDDPVPAGATILGSGLGRDAGAVLPQAGTGFYPPAFVERTSTAYRAYFDYLPAGRVSVSYTVRLNAIGSFVLPPTRVEALYRPDLYGSFPNHDGLAVGKGVFDDADAD